LAWEKAPRNQEDIVAVRGRLYFYGLTLLVVLNARTARATLSFRSSSASTLAAVVTGGWEGPEMVRRYIGDYSVEELKTFPTVGLDQILISDKDRGLPRAS